jgi:hypothetical protein
MVAVPTIGPTSGAEGLVLMDTETDFWCGSLNGMHVVYDPKIQVPGSRWVLLFQVRRNGLIPYTKAHARSVLHPISDLESRLSALKAYEYWHRTATHLTLADAASDIRRKDEYLEKKLANAIAMHRHCLERVAIPYGGITEPDGRGVIRNTVCRGCHRDIGTEAHLLCNRCGWIVCLSCGACGCGWEGGERRDL